MSGKWCVATTIQALTVTGSLFKCAITAGQTTGGRAVLTRVAVRGAGCEAVNDHEGT